MSTALNRHETLVPLLPASTRKGSVSAYKQELRELQIKLTTLQRHLIEHQHKVIVIFEGRDASGKDGVIKRITEHLSPRDTRVVALGKPSSREQSQWYFQRYVSHLPAAGEWVLFNRSWYNRAGIEPVMGFCTDDEYKAFLEGVVTFEKMLKRSGIQIVKYYLDISRDEQEKRLEARKRDPLKQWKISPVDAVALEHWRDYSHARNVMLETTGHDDAPWVVVRADDKKSTRLNVIRDLLTRIACPEVNAHMAIPNPRVVFAYSPKHRRQLAC